MLTRRGFTLVELLISIVLLGFVALAGTRIMTSMLRVGSAQAQLAGAQGTSRTGSLAIPSEFREIGFDTIPGVGTDSDLESIKTNRLSFRAMRGVGFTCSVAAGINEFRIRTPIFGMRAPAITDSFRLFVENDVNRGDDDQWVSLPVTAIDPASTCGADPAIRITLAAAPLHSPGGTNILASEVFVGGPIRWYERLEYGPVIDAGRTYVGARSMNLGQNTLIAMIGPLPDSTGFTLTYYDAAGAVLDPAVASNRIKVRSIGVRMVGSTTAPISSYGASTRSRAQSPVFTRVALRNNLRPAP